MNSLLRKFAQRKRSNMTSRKLMNRVNRGNREKVEIWDRLIILMAFTILLLFWTEKKKCLDLINNVTQWFTLIGWKLNKIKLMFKISLFRSLVKEIVIVQYVKLGSKTIVSIWKIKNIKKKWSILNIMSKLQNFVKSLPHLKQSPSEKNENRKKFWIQMILQLSWIQGIRLDFKRYS